MVIRFLCTNEAILFASVSSLLAYKGTLLRPQSAKTSVHPPKAIIIITLMTDFG